MATPVTTVASGGLAIVEVTGFGMAVTETTRGIAVTKVTGKPGLPVKFVSATGGSVGDPFIANVGLLHGFEGTDGQTGTFPAEVGGGTVNINSGTAKISTTQKRQGNSSLFVGTGGASMADSPNWDLSDANSDEFTIEYALYQTNWAGAHHQVLAQSAAGQQAFIIRHTFDTGQIIFFGSSDGSSFNVSITTAGNAPANNVWRDYCVEKDNTGKIRIYVDGVMRGSGTPANSALFNSNQVLLIGDIAAPLHYMDELRITKGKARYKSDSGYTPTGGPFPRV
jgi:hypothetical protein